ncbi:hypothetical protein ACFOSD_13700 [Salinispirillum marinum]|uniref:Uncharacterized protein n=2 Tax=Saccharospirillaceae TaxID=255527 RepID=A0ABV8BGA8_9GAMM
MSNPTWSVALALILCLGSTVHAQTRLRRAAVDNPDMLLLCDLLTPDRRFNLCPMKAFNTWALPSFFHCRTVWQESTGCGAG